MKFAHTGDCHLGGWRHPELTELTIESFRFFVTTCIKEKLDFVLIAGDLFDTSYPSIETIKESFNEFRRLKEANIPVFLIAGSHDYSVSGKTFLDVLEKSGFATNVFNSEERNNTIYLLPTIYKNVAIYGYPGKRSALEVSDIERIKLHESPGLFQILMLHTALRDAIGNLPIPAVDQDKLPKVNYTALGHLHVNYNKNNRVYCGPLFPNNAQELEELKGGSFYIVDTNGKVERREIKLKEIIIVEINLKDAFKAQELINQEISKHIIKDKIIILKLSGVIERGKIADIPLAQIESEIKKSAYVLLKSTSKLYSQELEVNSVFEPENLEEKALEKFMQESKSPFVSLTRQIISNLSTEKKEEERTQIFEERIMSEITKIMQ